MTIVCSSKSKLLNQRFATNGATEAAAQSQQRQRVEGGPGGAPLVRGEAMALQIKVASSIRFWAVPGLAGLQTPPLRARGAAPPIDNADAFFGCVGPRKLEITEAAQAVRVSSASLAGA